MPEQIDNLALWNQVSTTDPDFTKKVQKNKQYSFTAINATWQIKQATKLWGSYGDPRWWLDYRWDDLHIGKEVVILHATFRYPGGSFPIMNAIKLRGKYAVDEDAFKKLDTDTTTKALSKLGFSADIFSGCWDHQKNTDYQQPQNQTQNQTQNQQGYHQ